MQEANVTAEQGSQAVKQAMSGPQGGRPGVARVHRGTAQGVGLRSGAHEASIDREKPDALGATTDLSRVRSHGVAAVEPAKEKTEPLAHQLEACEASDKCTPTGAEIS